ncbi:PadR family transcriptional regulator [uncultured Psychrosphaera sp.]|jgi:PadR family transcriptional regulator PadR|uniref:PadR family transcriptional regulator n=1 Tax=uncultured Psychrosphaera sp. TaxID=1403522 RepID=UPI0030F6B086
MMTKHENLNEKWDVQLRKGSLELVILAALKNRTLYGLEVLKLLHSFETMKITEGTLYPLLDRLKRDGLVSAVWQQEGETRPRKYYQLTQQGEQKLDIVTKRWRQSVKDVEFLIQNPGPKSIQLKGE